MISDERLKQAVHEAAEALDRSLPDPEACTYEPSPEFEARMQTLIREMGEKRERKERRRKLAHRAACLAIAVVAALHLWKGQMLLSIAGGTICYMLLVQFVF